MQSELNSLCRKDRKKLKKRQRRKQARRLGSEKWKEELGLTVTDCPIFPSPAHDVSDEDSDTYMKRVKDENEAANKLWEEKEKEFNEQLKKAELSKFKFSSVSIEKFHTGRAGRDIWGGNLFVG
eukprot:CAMPEP_0177644946 /NCGR_PEP_ID=MMETSP0447-20121125/8978_1 /TAXON_ID=0 /ORGANISM="Stygamoeba regulata, Strain BSH-02190019" /LENGTH=123 /DNA_ID=CAMNT_0019147379 /DNA_START=169 /DNA_END=540 /DNA_ORIENTATION=-